MIIILLIGIFLAIGTLFIQWIMDDEEGEEK